MQSDAIATAGGQVYEMVPPNEEFRTGETVPNFENPPPPAPRRGQPAAVSHIPRKPETAGTKPQPRKERHHQSPAAAQVPRLPLEALAGGGGGGNPPMYISTTGSPPLHDPQQQQYGWTWDGETPLLPPGAVLPPELTAQMFAPPITNNMAAAAAGWGGPQQQQAFVVQPDPQKGNGGGGSSFGFQMPQEQPFWENPTYNNVPSPLGAIGYQYPALTQPRTPAQAGGLSPFGVGPSGLYMLPPMAGQDRFAPTITVRTPTKADPAKRPRPGCAWCSDLFWPERPSDKPEQGTAAS